MYTYANKTQENKTRSVANRVANNNSRTTYTAQFVDNRPLAIQMRKLQERENNSLTIKGTASDMGFKEIRPSMKLHYISFSGK